jgi:ABC-type uncharacterized transport system permease subunit
MPSKRRKLFPGFWRAARQSAAARSADRLSYSFSLSLEVILFFLVLSIYQAAYAGAGDQVSLSLQQTVWTLVIGRVIGVLGEQALAWRMSDDVSSGRIQTFINRPLSYPFMALARYFGQAGLSLAPFLFILPLLGFFWIGWPPVTLITWTSVAWFVVLFVLGAIMRILLFMALGLSAFWTENAGPAIGVVRKIFMLFGGTFFPLQFLSGPVRGIVEYSPFGAAAAATFFFEPSFSRLAFDYLLVQAAWIVFFGLSVVIMWNWAQKRVFINGG